MGRRVLILLGGLPVGGAEVNVVAVMPWFVKVGIEPIVCTLSRDSDSFLAERLEQETGCSRFDLGADGLFDLPAMRRLRQLVRAEGVEIVHAEDQYSSIFGGFATRALPTRFVLTRHVLLEWMHPAREAVKSRLVFLAARHADAVVTVSEAVRDRFARQAHLAPERIDVIHNGIDLEPFEPAADDRVTARTLLGWEPDRPVVTIVGVVRPGKGHELLLDAVPALKAAHPGVTVKIVGGGDLSPALMDVVASFGDTVDILGARADIPEILAASDVIVQASHSEGLPTVMMEAGAAGRPVVATDVGGTRDVVRHDETGVIVAKGDSEALAAGVLRLLSDPCVAREMGRRARERIFSTFSLEVQATQTAALYDRVASDR
jgi:glycosyltransferase involved in cell wall biosynthesis